MQDLKAAVVDEYRREFVAEGQMFYTYKRLQATNMKWYSTPIEEKNYIVPLPPNEFDPNLK
ncbi:hypothetical protein D3C72_2285880 [compost metagenome]